MSILLNCSNPKCSNEIKRTNGDYLRSQTKLFYCSKKCAAIVNNTIPKRKRFIPQCTLCSTEVKRGRKYCQNCKPLKFDYNILKIKDIDIQCQTYIRKHSRRIYNNSSKPKKCLVCGYNLHYEVCHIKPVYTFPKGTLISRVNQLNNLVALCRNHHWELDNGYISALGESRTPTKTGSKPV